MDEFISSKDAAEDLGYTIQHTRLLIREGKLDARKFGRDWMVVRESVARYRVSRDMQVEEQIYVDESIDFSSESLQPYEINEVI